MIQKKIPDKKVRNVWFLSVDFQNNILYGVSGNNNKLFAVAKISPKVEAAIDWESARFTKPEKPLNAYQTWKKYYSDIDMEDTLKQLGFWEE